VNTGAFERLIGIRPTPVMPAEAAMLLSKLPSVVIRIRGRPRVIEKMLRAIKVLQSFETGLACWWG
jgi:hypothetical protein